MLIGYARVSTQDQNLNLQKDALKQAGCEKIIVDVGTGTIVERSGLAQLQELLRRDDVLVVWRLDRLGRSLKHLIGIVTDLEKAGIGFRSLTESIDTTSPGGRLTFHIFGALAEYERNIIVERTRAGLEAARARGRFGGRPKRLNVEQRQLARKLYREKQHTAKDIAKMLGISRTTLYAYLEEGQDDLRVKIEIKQTEDV